MRFTSFSLPNPCYFLSTPSKIKVLPSNAILRIEMDYLYTRPEWLRLKRKLFETKLSRIFQHLNIGRSGQKVGNLRNPENLGKFFSRFIDPSFRFWPWGKIENSQIRKVGIIFSRFPRFPTFQSFRFVAFSFFKKLFFHFPKVHKEPFADVLQNRCSWKFARLTGKYLCWSLFLTL